MEEEKSTTQKEKGGKNKKLIGIIIGIVIAAVVVFIVVRVVTNQSTKRDVITAENVDQLVETEDEPSDIPKNYTVMQNSEWTFPDGTSESTNAYVENSTDNVTPVYFELKIDELDEIVYTSPVLELGAHIENFALDTDLEKGTYEGTVIYHLVDEDQKELTTVNIGVSVIVEK